MFRRSRFSVRPNVGTAGRTAATHQEAPSASQEATESPRDTSESSSAPAVTDSKSDVTLSEKTPAPGDGSDQNGDGTNSSAAVQRRKRFSIKPKVAPGRTSTVSRTPKSPVKAIADTPVEVSGSDLDKPTTSSQTGTTTAPQGLQSPRRRRPSEDSKQSKQQPKAPILSSSSELLGAPPAEDSLEQTHLQADSSKQSDSMTSSLAKEVPPRPPDKVPPSLPDKEAIEISEKAKTLVSSKNVLSLTPSAFSLSKLLNDPSDLQRLVKAQKLRELLRQERRKEKRLKKAKARPKEYTLDPAKMTMRDLIRYLPTSNPMTSSLEDSVQENETVVPPSPEREQSPERAQEPEVPPNTVSSREEEEVGEEEEEEAAAEEEQEDALMVPQVKVAEDGSLIIDEESLTVEVQRAKGPNPAQNRNPIFERGSTTTYSSFRKGNYSKPWTTEETDMFYLAVSMVGTDFSMICQLFPHRARSEIKNKFKKEERENSWRIDKAFRERRRLDIEYFSKLLEKVLEFQKNRKKLKSLAEKNSPRKRKRKAKGKKSARKLSDVEEGDEENENQVPDLEEEEEEGEKENEDLCNEGGTPVSEPKRKAKRKNRPDASTEEPNDKKNRTDKKSNEQGEASIPEDAEASLPEDHTNPDMSEKTQNVNTAEGTVIKPAKLSRSRPPKPLLPLGRKWGVHLPHSTKAKDAASDTGEETVDDGASKEQVNKDGSPLSQANTRRSASDDNSSEEEDTPLKPLRPTRYGRVPKPTKPLTYPAKEDAHTSASEGTSASPTRSTAPAAKPKPKCTAKRGRPSKLQSAQKSKKPKVVTLRASQTEFSDEENENQWEEEEVEEQQLACSSGQDSNAPVFVPAGLHTPHPVISDVDETMVEFDILASMPDVLGISQDALCPESSCEQAQHETDTPEPCEHQLDLLVDVIDFLSSENTEVSQDESYNEAAQTLLTIGNLAHITQSAQNQIAIQDHISGAASAGVNETCHLEEEVVPKPAAQEESATPSVFAAVSQEVTETSETFNTVEGGAPDSGDMPIINTSDQMCAEQKTVRDTDLTPQLQSNPESSSKGSPQTKRGRLPKVKPKPNLGRTSRTAPPKFQAEMSTLRTAEERHSAAPSASEANETLSAAEEATPKIPDCAPALLKDDISCTKVKLTEEPSDSQERFADQAQSCAATSGQNSSEIQSCCFSEFQFESSRNQPTGDTKSTSESTHEKHTSRVGTADTGFNNPTTSDSAITEVERASYTDSAPVQESSSKPPPCAEDLPLRQKEESEVATTSQSRRSRLQKVKPKPNLPQTSRTARSKPQTTKDLVEKDSSPTPNPKLQKKTMGEVEPQPTCTPSPEKQSQSAEPASVLKPSVNLASALTPTKELSTKKEKNTNVGLVDQVELGAATSDQCASENQNFSKVQVKSSREQTARDTGSASEFADENPTSCGRTAESSGNKVVTTDSVTPAQFGQESNVDSAPVQGGSSHPAVSVTPVEELPVSQEVVSTCQLRRSRLQKVKPKPNLPQTPRTVQSKRQSTRNPVTLTQLVEKPCSPPSRPESTDSTITTEEVQPTCSTTTPEESSPIKRTPSASASSLELSSTEQEKTGVGYGLVSSTEGLELNVPQRRRRFTKVKPKPNLGSSSRITLTKLQSDDISKPSEDCHMDTSSSEQQPGDTYSAQTDLKLRDKDSKHLNAELTSKFGPEGSAKLLDSTNKKGTSSDGVVIATPWVGENQSQLTDYVPENVSSKATVEMESPVDRISNKDQEMAGPGSEGDCKLDTKVAESNTQQINDPNAVSDVQSSKDGSTEAKIHSVLTTNANPICSERDSSVQSTDDAQSELTDSSKTSRRAPQGRRGRLIKPKPNLGSNTRPPQPQKVHSTAAADSGRSSQVVDASVDHRPVFEVRPGVQEPAEGVIDELSKQRSPPSDARPSLGCVTQISSTQNASSSTEGIQSYPVYTEMLPEQVSSDPDEPFFILSLTEIPVSSSGEVVNSTAEHLSYLAVTDASMQQPSSVSGESLAAAGDGSVSNVPVPMSTEEIGEMSVVRVQDMGPDQSAYEGSTMMSPVDPHGSTTVQPPNFLETANNETEASSTKQRQLGTARSAKQQVKSSTTGKKQTSKTLAAKKAESVCTQANTTQDSEHPGPSVQPKAFDDVVTEPQKGDGGHLDTDKKALTGGKEPGSSSGAQMAQTVGTSNRKRKPKDTAPLGSPPPGKTPSKGSKVNPPFAAGKQSLPIPVASTSQDVVLTQSPTQPPKEAHSTSITSPTQTEVDIQRTSEHTPNSSDPTPSTSQCTAEVSASQQSDGVESSSREEEPTSVSQYFLSDIFTDVDEG